MIDIDKLKILEEHPNFVKHNCKTCGFPNNLIAEYEPNRWLMFCKNKCALFKLYEDAKAKVKT